MNGDQEKSTRSAILHLLKRKGEQSVGRLSEELGITEMAVRRHMNTLERDGLVASVLVRQAMGRPTNMYSLTEEAESVFPNNYSGLTLELLEELEAELGGDPVGGLFERRKKRMIRKYAGRIKGETLADKVRDLARIQNENGYMAESEKAQDGTLLLTEYNCPISQVAGKYNQACHCELALFESLLGAKVERTECLAKGGRKCVYVVREAD